MKTILIATFLILFLVDNSEARHPRFGKKTPSKPYCRSPWAWESGYPKVSVVPREDCIMCANTFEIHHGMHWERKVEVETKVGLSLSDIVDISAQTTVTVSNIEGTRSSYTCRNQDDEKDFVCMVLKYEEVITEGWMRRKRMRRSGPMGRNWNCITDRDYVKVRAYRKAYPSCAEKTHLYCKAPGFVKVI